VRINRDAPFVGVMADNRQLRRRRCCRRSLLPWFFVIPGVLVARSA
jgi:hypothetical protein